MSPKSEPPQPEMITRRTERGDVRVAVVRGPCDILIPFVDAWVQHARRQGLVMRS